MGCVVSVASGDLNRTPTVIKGTTCNVQTSMIRAEARKNMGQLSEAEKIYENIIGSVNTRLTATDISNKEANWLSVWIRKPCYELGIVLESMGKPEEALTYQEIAYEKGYLRAEDAIYRLRRQFGKDLLLQAVATELEEREKELQEKLAQQRKAVECERMLAEDEKNKISYDVDILCAEIEKNEAAMGTILSATTSSICKKTRFADTSYLSVEQVFRQLGHSEYVPCDGKPAMMCIPTEEGIWDVLGVTLTELFMQYKVSTLYEKTECGLLVDIDFEQVVAILQAVSEGHPEIGLPNLIESNTSSISLAIRREVDEKKVSAFWTGAR
jgi:tetratricopeptide (TPR) repeat protein